MLNSTYAWVGFVLEYKAGPNPSAMGVTARYFLRLTDIINDNPGHKMSNRIFAFDLILAMSGLDNFEE
jgi:hypothetical protein